jgi:hypothetical protein
MIKKMCSSVTVTITGFQVYLVGMRGNKGKVIDGQQPCYTQEVRDHTVSERCHRCAVGSSTRTPGNASIVRAGRRDALRRRSYWQRAPPPFVPHCSTQLHASQRLYLVSDEAACLCAVLANDVSGCCIHSCTSPQLQGCTGAGVEAEETTRRASLSEAAWQGMHEQNAGLLRRFSPTFTVRMQQWERLQEGRTGVCLGAECEYEPVVLDARPI